MLYSPFSSRTGDTLCNIKDVLFEYIYCMHIEPNIKKNDFFSRMSVRELGFNQLCNNEINTIYMSLIYFN